VNVVLWIVASLLALAFLVSGGMKLTQPKDKLLASGQGWAEDFSPVVIKLIGALEVLAAVGLVLPAVVHVATVLVPLAATGLVLVMIGAMATHTRRHETQMAVVNVVLLLLAGFVAWGRFGPYSFGS
jgi:uncharacterized membrane protein YphA (DoxX/SURF4 family)